MVDPLPPFISPAHNIYSRPRTPPPNRTHKTYVVIYTPTFVCIAEQGKILSVNLFEIQSWTLLPRHQILFSFFELAAAAI